MSDDHDSEDDDEVARQIAGEVAEAFARVSYPGDDRLLESPTHWESASVLEAFRGKQWRSVALDVLFTHRLSLALFSPEAFRFYLPAYLTAALLHSEAVDTLRENVFFLLTPSDSDGVRSNWLQARIALLDAKQKAAIRRFVELYVEREQSYPDPHRQRALAYWHTLDPK